MDQLDKIELVEMDAIRRSLGISGREKARIEEVKIQIGI